MTFPNLIIGPKAGVTVKILIRRQWRIIVVGVVPFIFTDKLVKVTVEFLNIVFTSSLIESFTPDCVFAEMIDEIFLFLHEILIILVENDRMYGAMLWWEIMFSATLGWLKGSVSLDWVMDDALLRVFQWYVFGAEGLLLVDTASHAAAVHWSFKLLSSGVYRWTVLESFKFI